MKHLLWLALAALTPGAQGAPYTCTFESGRVVEAALPCEPAMVRRFSKRLIELYPEVREINTSPDYLMGLYGFAMPSCTGHFASMTPQAIGEGSEPFFPAKMMAAMVQAGREVMCPGLR